MSMVSTLSVLPAKYFCITQVPDRGKTGHPAVVAVCDAVAAPSSTWSEQLISCTTRFTLESFGAGTGRLSRYALEPQGGSLSACRRTGNNKVKRRQSAEAEKSAAASVAGRRSGMTRFLPPRLFENRTAAPNWSRNLAWRDSESRLR